jgi:methionine salvage enolase-phosphatase E1
MLAVIPILGVDLAEEVKVGPISFVPHGEAALPYAERHVLDLVHQPLVETPVHAVFATNARLLRDAEERAVEATDVVRLPSADRALRASLPT